MSKATDSGKAFIEAVLAKLPENLREGARAAFTAPEAADALTAVGDGVLARADYSRSKDELDARKVQLDNDYQRLNGWYTEHEQIFNDHDRLVAENRSLKAGVVPPVDTRVTPQPDPKLLDRDTFNKEMNDLQTQAGRYFNTVTKLAARHLRDFNEVLDADELADFAMGKKIGIVDAYELKFKDQLDARKQAAEDARINKLVDERYATRMKDQQTQPFPVRGAEPSVLDVLDSKEDAPSKHTLDTATALYESLQTR